MKTCKLEDFTVFVDDEGYITGAETEIDGEAVPVVLAYKKRGCRYAEVTERTKFRKVMQAYYGKGAYAFFRREDMTWTVK